MPLFSVNVGAAGALYDAHSDVEGEREAD